MSWNVIDVETCGHQEASLRVPEFFAAANLKDPEKIKADIESKRREWLEKTALSATSGYILAVGVLKEDCDPLFIEGDEVSIITAVWKLWDDKASHLIGHNIKGFDLPFLIRRSWMNGIRPPNDLMRGRYWNDLIIDTMERWSCGNYQERISLDNLAQAFGLPGKNGKGSEFGKKYLKGGDDRLAALAYLKNDLLLTKMVAKSMCVI